MQNLRAGSYGSEEEKQGRTRVEGGAGKAKARAGRGSVRSLVRTDGEDEGDDAAADPAHHLPAPGAAPPAAGATGPGERRVAGGPREGGAPSLQLRQERAARRIHGPGTRRQQPPHTACRFDSLRFASSSE